MKRKRFFQGIGSGIAMLILILDSRTALEGAQTGIALCIKTIIPALFPFFVLSALFTSTVSGQQLSVLRPIASICGLPRGGEAILIPAFLGGYPVGAQCIAQAYCRGLLSREEAERHLCFCSNAGPAFLFGMGTSLFPHMWMIWALWGIHILSALLVAASFPAATHEWMEAQNASHLSASELVNTSLRVMASVCGWVILFRIGITFLQRWLLWRIPDFLQAAMIGLLELTNGFCQMSCISNISIRFIICAGLVSFGGVCVILQTISVCNGLSIRYYIMGKLMQCALSMLLAAIIITNPAALGIILPGSLLILIKCKNRGSFRKVLRV